MKINQIFFIFLLLTKTVNKYLLLLKCRSKNKARHKTTHETDSHTNVTLYENSMVA